jgi:uncharacterized membrane protein YcaP (DUF421 family)
VTEPPPFSKEHRKAERARINRLSRLPFLYDFALQGKPQTVLAGLVQVVLAIGLALVVAQLLTGQWFPRWVALIALAIAFGLQAVSRYLNARAGRS